MKLDELEKLAKAEPALGFNSTEQKAICGSILVKTDTILTLIALCRMQHEALKLVHTAMPTTLTCDDFHHSKKDEHDCEETCPVTARYYYAESMADDAIASFDHFGKE